MTAHRTRSGARKVPCPACQHPQSKVLWSRGNARRRKCLGCGGLFRTREHVIGHGPIAWPPVKPRSGKRISLRHRLPELLSLSGGCCVYCGTVDGPFEVDHIVAIAVGGTNDRKNLIPACKACNRAKRAKRLSDFMASRGITGIDWSPL